MAFIAFGAWSRVQYSTPRAILTSRPAPHAIKPIQCPGGTITSMYSGMYWI